MNNQYDPNNQNNPNNQYQQQNQNNPNNQYQQQNQNNPNNQYQQQNQYNPNGQKQGSGIDDIIAKVKNFLLNTPVEKEPITPQDIAENKGITVLAYLGVLCWIPLVAKPNSKFARFHFNQGLILLIVAAIAGAAVGIVTAILSIIPIIGAILSIVIPSIVSLATLVGVVVGIYNVVNGRVNELPYIGKYRIVKTAPTTAQAPNSFNNVPPQNGYNNPPQQNSFDASAYNSTTPQQTTGFDADAYSSGTVNAGFDTNTDTNANN